MLILRRREGNAVQKIIAMLMAVICLCLAFSVRAEEALDMEHYLLIGTDGWGGKRVSSMRSDAIILATLDYGRDRIIFTSFARDSIVKPSYRKGTVKLNTLVRSEEGEQALVNYIEETYGVPISGRFIIDFSGTVDVINAIGGIEIELSQQEVDYVNHHAGYYEGYPLSEGISRLNGGQALYYMRCRSLDNDFGRQGRQGKVLRAMVSKLSAITPVRALMLVDEAQPYYHKVIIESNCFGSFYTVEEGESEPWLGRWDCEIKYHYTSVTDYLENDTADGLKKALDDLNMPYVINEGDGAFYGPKIDFHLEDSIGRTWQCGTIQLDFQLPMRFEAEYTGADGAKHRPIMIHRVAFGSIERFIGILIEHFAGKFPTWLAPVQVKLLPITDRNNEYTDKIEAILKAAGVRCESDKRQEKTGFKVREAQLMKIPFMLVLGDKEQEEGTVAVRRRDSNQTTVMPVDEFVSMVTQLIKDRK